MASRLQERLSIAARGDILSALADELGNMRTAWGEWVVRVDVAQLNRLLAPLWGYYDARGDYRSAIELGRELLRCLAETPDSPDRRRDEFAVRMSVVRTELAVRGYTADAEQMIRDTLERADVAGDAGRRFVGLRSLCYLHVMRSDFGQTTLIADELMAIAEEVHDPLLLSEAHLMTGLSRAWRVDLLASLEPYDKAVEYAEVARSGYVDFRVGPHPSVVANVVAGLTQWMVGRPETAFATMQHALDLAAHLDHPYSTAYALHHAALLDLLGEDMETVVDRADALWAIAEAHDYPVWRALALVFGGVAAVGSGDADAGMELVDQGFEMYGRLSAPPVFWPALLMVRSKALGMAQRNEEALVVIEEAEALLQPGDPMAPDVGLVHGDLLLVATPHSSMAAAEFERVASLAAQRGARMAQLQACTRLAVLRRGTPGEHEALGALRDVYDQMTEGFDTPHLAAARAVLAGDDTAVNREPGT